jgi:hypothetical protein
MVQMHMIGYEIAQHSLPHLLRIMWQYHIRAKRFDPLPARKVVLQMKDGLRERGRIARRIKCGHAKSKCGHIT